MSATEISIHAETCRKDGLCALVCPVRVFAGAKGDPPSVRRASECVLCGQCLAVCPSGSIAHNRFDRERFQRIEERRPVEGEAMIAFLRQRRSVRAYKPDPVPRDRLEAIAGVAGYAPTSAHGGEGWVRSVTIASGAEEMRRVAALTAEYLREIRAVLESPVVKVVSRFKIEPRRGRSMLPDLDMRLGEWDQGRDAITYGAPAAIFVHTPRTTNEPSADCDAALFSIMLAAHAQGLGTCWNGWLARAAEAFKAKRATGLRRMLRIPEHHEVGAAMTIGYPAVRLHSVPDRRTSIRFASADPPA